MGAGLSEDMYKVFIYLRTHPSEYESLTNVRLSEAIAKIAEISTETTEGLSSKEASLLLYRLNWPVKQKEWPAWVQNLVTDGFPHILVTMVHSVYTDNLDLLETIQ